MRDSSQSRSLEQGASQSQHSAIALRSKVEDGLKEVLADSKLAQNLERAVSYSLLEGGKRVRPLLCLLLAGDLEVYSDDLLKAALSLEFIHCSSLIHDDLPALDNDDLRRGRPSCHRAFDEGTAILAGDVLVGMAFRNLSALKFNDEIKTSFLGSLSKAFEELCSGQQLDLELGKDFNDLARVHRLKTGALFSAAAEFAGIVRGDEFKGISSELGMSIGLYFQLVDDFVDVFGSEIERGRKESSDTRNLKPTNFTIDGGDISQAPILFQSAEERVQRSLERIGEKIGKKPNEFTGVGEFLSLIRSRKDSCLRSC